eukprot:358521-Chlamydomonas_euryale.AAC.1
MAAATCASVMPSGRSGDAAAPATAAIASSTGNWRLAPRSAKAQAWPRPRSRSVELQLPRALVAHSRWICKSRSNMRAASQPRGRETGTSPLSREHLAIKHEATAAAVVAADVHAAAAAGM